MLDIPFPHATYYLCLATDVCWQEAAHIRSMLTTYESVVVLRETGADGKWGVATTHERKMSFVAVIEQLLNENAIFISNRLASDDPEECLAALKKQMGAFRKVNSEVGKATVFGLPKITYSGKVGEDGRMMPHAMQDDLCITLQLLAFWSSYVVQRRCKFLNYEMLFGAAITP